MQVERDVVLQFRPSVRLFQYVPIVILFWLSVSGIILVIWAHRRYKIQWEPSLQYIGS